MQHLVEHVRGVLRRLELDLPGPVEIVAAGKLARLKELRVVVGLLVHRVRDGEHEAPARIRVDDRLAHVVLDRRVVRDTQPDVDVLLLGRVPLRDVDRTHRQAVPHGR